jgi:hypothetical protein
VEQNLIYHVMAKAAGLPAAGADIGTEGDEAAAAASPAEEEPAQQTGADTPPK